MIQIMMAMATKNKKGYNLWYMSVNKRWGRRYIASLRYRFPVKRTKTPNS